MKSLDDLQLSLKVEYSRKRIDALQRAGKAKQAGDDHAHRYWMDRAKELAVRAGYRASYGEVA